MHWLFLQETDYELLTRRLKQIEEKIDLEGVTNKKNMMSAFKELKVKYKHTKLDKKKKAGKLYQ